MKVIRIGEFLNSANDIVQAEKLCNSNDGKIVPCYFILTSMRKFLSHLRNIGSAMDTKVREATSKFFEAVKANDVEKVIELLKNRLVSVDSRDATSDDQTALHIAADKGYYEITRILIDEYNAPVNAVDRDDQIPLQLATGSYNMKIVKFLLKRNSNLREYAEHQLNDESVDELFEAASSNDIAKIEELLRGKRVDVDSRDKGDYNRTILQIAASKGYENLARILVDEYGANVNHEDDLGDTAKHMAVDNEYPTIAKFLIERGYKDPRPCSDSLVDLSDIHEPLPIKD